jgi:hypothetical protein
MTIMEKIFVLLAEDHAIAANLQSNVHSSTISYSLFNGALFGYSAWNEIGADSMGRWSHLNLSSLP